MSTTTTDRMQKQILLKAPRSRVWKAITDSQEFGTWFQVALEGDFVVGESIYGQITYPGYEHLRFEATVERMDPEEVFAYRWCPTFPEESTTEPHTLVEFRLKETEEGTLLTLTESGFDLVSEEFRELCFRRNEGGWTEQMENIRRHVDG